MFFFAVFASVCNINASNNLGLRDKEEVQVQVQLMAVAVEVEAAEAVEVVVDAADKCYRCYNILSYKKSKF